MKNMFFYFTANYLLLVYFLNMVVTVHGILSKVFAQCVVGLLINVLIQRQHYFFIYLNLSYNWLSIAILAHHLFLFENIHLTNLV